MENKYQVNSPVFGNTTLAAPTRKGLRATLRQVGFKGSHKEGKDVFYNANRQQAIIEKIVK